MYNQIVAMAAETNGVKSSTFYALMARTHLHRFVSQYPNAAVMRIADLLGTNR
jgi:hypothetical protein